MRLILFSLICLVTIVSVLAEDPGPSECSSDSCSTKDRALMEADALLKSKEADADNLERNFDGASELLNEFEANEHGAHPNVIGILQAFLNLRSIGADLNNFRPQCTTAEFDKLIPMKRLMEEFPTETEEKCGGSRIRGFLDIMRRRYFEICSKKVKLAVKMNRYLSGLHNFRIFINTESGDESSYLMGIHFKSYVNQLGVAENWKHLLLCLKPLEDDLVIVDSSTGEYQLDESYITELFNNLFEETCDRIDTIADLRETFELGSEILDEYYTDVSLDPSFTFEPLIGDYVICKAAKEYDYLRLLREDFEEEQRA